MKNRLIDFLIFILIVLMWVSIWMYVMGCTTDAELTPIDETPDIVSKISWCIPANYEIIYNGEFYTWRYFGSFMYWDMFNTLDGAIESACRHNYIQTMQRYNMLWEVMPVCHFQEINT